MQIRIIVPAIAALLSLSACSQSRTSTSTAVPQTDSTAVKPTRITDSQIVQNTSQRVIPDPRYNDEHLNGYPEDYSSSDGYDDRADRHIRIRAPFVNLNIDRDSGSVHLHTPFVRVDKGRYGQGTDIDLPSTHVESQSVHSADWPTPSTR